MDTWTIKKQKINHLLASLFSLSALAKKKACSGVVIFFSLWFNSSINIESDLNWEEAYLLFTVAYIKRGSWALKEGYGILFSVSPF